MDGKDIIASIQIISLVVALYALLALEFGTSFSDIYYGCRIGKPESYLA